MKFSSTSLPGVRLVRLELREDDRGSFARMWCTDEFKTATGMGPMVQASLSFNTRAGTLRGLHMQRSPHEESKVVSCVRGRMYDVVVDMRPRSSTYGMWTSFELSGLDGLMVYVPKGCAHGFQTLEPDTVVQYFMDESYHPDSAVGYRWDDPTLGIRWPIADPIMSSRDANYPFLNPNAPQRRDDMV
jgi:dTDP-4-dehydrorhamnose 3,5-epimerase